MADLRVLAGKDVCKILGKNGFKKVRTRGSHVVMQRRLPDTTITVPVPNHREIRTGTLLAIIRQSQLPRSLFETD